MSKRINCEYNIDTACVELRRGSTVILAVDCIAVEDQLARNLYERSALDYAVLQNSNPGRIMRKANPDCIVINLAKDLYSQG